MAPRSDGRIGRNTVSAIVRRRAIVRGVFGGSKTWLTLGAIFWTGNFLRRTLGRTEIFAAREVLKPGDSILIRTIPTPSRAQRKAVRRSR